MLGKGTPPSGSQSAAGRWNLPAQERSPWSAATSAGIVGGLLAGFLSWHGTGKLGFLGAAIVLILTSVGIKGGSRKALTLLLFVAVAALVLVAAILKQ